MAGSDRLTKGPGWQPGAGDYGAGMASPGTTGNVIAALASFFIPGLGQLIQGRLIRAFIFFVLAAILWWFWLGWLISIWATIDAALFKKPASAP